MLCINNCFLHGTTPWYVITPVFFKNFKLSIKILVKFINKRYGHQIRKFVILFLKLLYKIFQTKSGGQWESHSPSLFIVSWTKSLVIFKDVTFNSMLLFVDMAEIKDETNIVPQMLEKEVDNSAFPFLYTKYPLLLNKNSSLMKSFLLKKETLVCLSYSQNA